jgi:hypothetical protein
LICGIGFLVDIAGRLNELNCHLQGKDQLIHTLYDSVKGLQTKLVLREHHLKVNNYSHFPTLVEANERGAHNSEKYSNYIMTLTEKFNDRFCDFKAREILIKMCSSPFSVEIDATPTSLQLEFANFQSDSVLKEKFCDSSLTDFYS